MLSAFTSIILRAKKTVNRILPKQFVQLLAQRAILYGVYSVKEKPAFPRRFILLCKLYHISRNFAILVGLFCPRLFDFASFLSSSGTICTSASLQSPLASSMASFSPCRKGVFSLKNDFLSSQLHSTICNTYKSDFWRFGYWNNYQRFHLKMSLLHKNRLKTLIFEFFL